MRHDRVTIILLTYIIGFTTAFIAFGLDEKANKQVSLQKYSSHSAAETSQSLIGYENPLVVDTTMQSDGLYAFIDGYQRVLSAQVVNAIAPRDGYHYRIVSSEASPNGNYIVYCAQQTSQSSTCLVYIYELSTDSVFRAKNTNSDTQVELPLRGGMLSWQSNGRLTANGYASANSNRPWELQ